MKASKEKNTSNSRVTNSQKSSASINRNQEISRSSHQNMQNINNPSQVNLIDNQSEIPNFQQDHMELTDIKPQIIDGDDQAPNENNVSVSGVSASFLSPLWPNGGNQIMINNNLPSINDNHDYPNRVTSGRIGPIHHERNQDAFIEFDQDKPVLSKTQTFKNQRQTAKPLIVKQNTVPVSSVSSPSKLSNNVHDEQDVLSACETKSVKLKQQKTQLRSIQEIINDRNAPKIQVDEFLLSSNSENIEMESKKLVTNVFSQKQSSNTPYDQNKKKIFGLLPSEFESSTANPRRLDTLSCKHSHEKEKHDHKKGNWYDSLIISETSKVYILFNTTVTIIMLGSSYYYGFLAANRFHLIDLHEEDPSYWLREQIIVTCFELVFLIHMITQFFVEYKIEGQQKPVRNLMKISIRYLSTDFIQDLVCLLPFQMIQLHRNRQYMFYIIKMFRIIKGFNIFDVPNIMEKVKAYYQEQLQTLVKEKPEIANDINADNNSIEEVLQISYSLRILKLVVIILNISYLMGLMWLIMCDFINDFVHDMDKYSDEAAKENPETFIHYNGLNEKTMSENTIIATYFAFTSLSTVGFGDYHPRSDIERLLCAFILLFGVAIFSYIMGNFISILDQYQKFNEELEDGDRLGKFFGTMKHYNNEEPIEINQKLKIEAFFDYKWKTDKNMAFKDDTDRSIFEQLPEEVQQNIYQEFMFKEFLEHYKKIFSFPNHNSQHQPAFFTWEDQLYRNFMIEMLGQLEPRHEFKDVILFEEQDEVNEVIFFNNGTYEVGFEINRTKEMVLRYKNCNLIGAYGVTFNKRSHFVYKTFTDCEGFFIRREAWKGLIDNNPEVSCHLVEQVKEEYDRTTMNKVMHAKQHRLIKWNKRADYDSITKTISIDPKFIPENYTAFGLKQDEQCIQEDEDLTPDDHLAIMMDHFEGKFQTYEDVIQNLLFNNDDIYDKYIHLWAKYIMCQKELTKLRTNQKSTQ